MHNGEWSLISFTLLSQLSVGLVLALGFIFLMHQSVFANLNSGFSLKSPEIIILILILVATLLSLLHLGSPAHSYHSLNNIGGSWISREILTLSVFGFFVLLYFLSRLLNWPPVLSQILLALSAISGIIFIFAMVGIYMISVVPVWNSFNTPLSFWGSVFLLGFAGMLLFLGTSNPSQISHSMMIQMIRIMMIVSTLMILTSVFHQYQISKLSNTGIEQIQFGSGVFLSLFLVRIVLLIVVFLGLFYVMLQISKHSQTYADIQAYLLVISILILIEEVVGRYLFYGSYFRLGV